MKELRRQIKGILALFLVGFTCLVGYLSYNVYVNGSRWFSSPYNTRLYDQRASVIAGDILDRNDTTLATTQEDGKRVYPGDEAQRRATCHAVGDPYGYSAGGAESTQAAYLLAMNSSILDRTYQAVTGEKVRGNDVILTIDAALSEKIAGYMGDYRGAVALVNWRTGEVYAMVSQPGFDPMDMSAFKSEDTLSDDMKSALVNRATQGRYTPGSVMKIVVAATALERDLALTNQTFTCDGKTDIGSGKTISCYKGEVHGTVDMERGFTKSCNGLFATLGMELGKNNLFAGAEKFGFNQTFFFNQVPVYTANFPELDTDWDCAYAAIGQSTVTITPMHMALIAASIPNGGTALQPQLLAATQDSMGVRTSRLKTQKWKTLMKSSTAAALEEMMVATVEEGTGRNAQVEGYRVGGKTGTAEVSDDKGVSPHSWFVGFIDDEEHPLAIAVVLEHAGAGSQAAAPLAGKAFRAALEAGY